MKEKRFIVRKFIMARNAQHALQKEKRTKPDDCYIDDKWIDDNKQDLVSAIGFSVNVYED